MKNLFGAILIAGIAFGIITFMVVAGTILAPVAVVGLVVAGIYMLLLEERDLNER